MTDTRSAKEWEQVRLEVGLDQAPQLEALLGEILPGSLVVEKDYGDLFQYELDQFQGPVTLTGYYPAESSSRIRPLILAALDQAGCPAAPTFTSLQNQNWATAWQTRYHPIPLGQRLIVVPSWLENPQPDRLAIYIDPGMAFGSGTHPTTQLCLEMLESCIARTRPGRMIDVGCGSGILSIAAAKLGLPRVVGADVDPDAVEISRQNAAANQVSGRTAFHAGSVRDLLDLEADQGPSPLVAANIIAPILAELFEEGLGDLVAAGGLLVLSGILAEQAPAMEDWLERTGFEIKDRRQREEWVGLVGLKRGPAGAKERHSQV